MKFDSLGFAIDLCLPIFRDQRLPDTYQIEVSYRQALDGEGPDIRITELIDNMRAVVGDRMQHGSIQEVQYLLAAFVRTVTERLDDVAAGRPFEVESPFANEAAMSYFC